MLLLYCMSQDEPLPACGKLTGVGGAEVRDVAKNGVRYYFSDWNPGGTSQAVKEDVLRFHQVVQAVFAEQTVIPFRFPTSVAGEAELAALMEKTSSQYASEFARIGDAVEMRIRIKGKRLEDLPPASSGTEYLKQKQTAAAPVVETLKAITIAVLPIVRDTNMASRDGSAELNLLLQRTRQEELKRILSGLTGLPAAVTVSGPWPPSDFVNCYPELSQTKDQ